MVFLRWLPVLMCLRTLSMAQSPELQRRLGMLGPLHLKLHLKVSATGAANGTLDSIDQGAMGSPLADFHFDDKTLSFDVPSVGGKWHGTISDDGSTLNGGWSQGQERPLAFIEMSHLRRRRNRRV